MSLVKARAAHLRERSWTTAYDLEMIEDFADLLSISHTFPNGEEIPGHSASERVRQFLKRQQSGDIVERAVNTLKHSQCVASDALSDVEGVTVVDALPHGLAQSLEDGGSIVVVSDALIRFTMSYVRIVLNGIYRATAPKISSAFRTLGPGSPDPETGAAALRRDASHLGRLLGHTLELGMAEVVPFVDPRGLANAYAESLVTAAIGFIVYHEVAHVLERHHLEACTRSDVILHDHTGVIHSYGIEMEADGIAAMLLYRITNSGNLAYLGAFIALRVLGLMESGSDRHAPHRSHPPAAERLLRVTSSLDHAGLVTLDQQLELFAAFKRRTWLLDDTMQDQGLYYSPWKDVLGHIVAGGGTVTNEQTLAVARVVATGICFGEPELIARVLGTVLADAEILRACGDRPKMVDRLDKALDPLMRLLEAKGSARRFLERVRYFRERHERQHAAEPDARMHADCQLGYWQEMQAVSH